MKGFHRALLGALIGAVIVLILHPRTSPVYRTVFLSGDSKRLKTIDQIVPWSGSPKTELDYYYAAEIYSVRVHEGRLGKSELAAAAKLFRDATLQYPKNGMWNQLYASVLVRQNKTGIAFSEWHKASVKRVWTSGQSSLAIQRATRIANRLGFDQSWIWARAFLLRTPASTLEIEKTARALLTGASMAIEPGISVRFDTALNGDLINKKSKMISEGAIGTELVQLVAYPSNMIDTRQPKQLILGQDLIADSLRMNQRSGDADHLLQVFKNAESWTGLVTRRSVPEQIEKELVATLLISTTGGLAGLFLLIGLGIYVFQAAADSSLQRIRRFSPKLVIPVAVTVGALTGYITDYPLGGLIFGLVLLSWLWQPQSIRKSSPSDLGPLFNLTLRFLLVTSISTLFLFAVWNSVPFAGITPLYDGPWEGLEPKVWLRVAVLVLSLLVLVVPTWAFAQRLSAPAVARCLLIRSRTTLIWLGITLVLILGPVGIFMDNQQRIAWKDMIQNEPVYYLRQ